MAFASESHGAIITPRVKDKLCCQEDDIRVSWADRRLERICSEDKKGRREFGSRWPNLKRRIALLEEAECLADLHEAPGRWHPLKADRVGQWSGSLDANYRVIVEPDHQPLPQLVDGGLDTHQITQVKIIEVADYHGR